MSNFEPVANKTSVLSIIAFVFAALGFLIIPIIFSSIAIILAIIAKTQKEKLANIALGISIASLLVPALLGGLIGAGVIG